MLRGKEPFAFCIPYGDHCHTEVRVRQDRKVEHQERMFKKRTSEHILFNGFMGITVGYYLQLVSKLSE